MTRVLIEQTDLDKIGQTMSDLSRQVNTAMVTLGAIKISPMPNTESAAPTQSSNDSAMTPAQRDEADNSQNYSTVETAGISDVGGAKKRAIPWGLQCQALDPEFVDGLLWIESQIALAPEVLVPCMKFESNINPRARNPQSSASGLIQFMTGTAVALGTDIGAIRGMTAMQQLGYVFKYFKNQRDNWHGASASDVYMAILWPKAVGKDDDYVLWEGATEAYRVNAGLDRNKDRQVTKGEAASRVLELQKQGFEAGKVGYF